MDRFDKLYVIADEAAIWKQFDQTVKKQFFKDSALMTFIFLVYFSTFQWQSQRSGFYIQKINQFGLR